MEKDTLKPRKLSFIPDENRHQLYETEQLPNLKFYRAHDSITGKALKRPTIEELRAVHQTYNENVEIDVKDEVSEPKNIIKLGWFTGVMVRCLLALFGAILFLRLPWVMGNAGIVVGSMIIIISGIISLLTTLSLGSVATNGKVKAGGTYFLLSRTLGAEFGGPIGVTIAVTDLTSSAMVIIGVAYTIQEIIRPIHPTSFFLSINGTRVLGLIILILIASIILIGLGFESQIMKFMLLVLVISFANFIAGWFITTDEKERNGFTMFSIDTIKSNLWPDYLDGYGFISVFAVFFPAMTGILAGVNISGNLKNPQVAIPKGTLWATNVATLIYLAFGIASACIMCRGVTALPTSNYSCNKFNCNSSNCSIGLKSEIAMIHMSANKYLVYAGTFAATLSSASAVLVSGPKVFQAVCRDNILPGFLQFFSVGNSKTDEPIRLYILNFVLSGCLICIGDLNSVAHLLTNFVLLGYAFINFACFYASFAKAPGWRPTFKYYNKYVALFTALLCVVIMFLVQWLFAIVTLMIELILYLYVKWRNPAANWGSSSEANNYRIGLRLLKSLTVQGTHAKNFRPQCLILSGLPNDRLPLIKLINRITKADSLTICGNVILNESMSLSELQSSIPKVMEMFTEHKIHAFYTPVIDDNIRHGVRSLMQCTGFGVAKPNIIVMGFKTNWMTAQYKSTSEYFEIIRDTFDMSMGIVIARLNAQRIEKDPLQIDEDEDEGDIDQIHRLNLDDFIETEYSLSSQLSDNKIPTKIASDSTMKFIDIWWLFEDGGLTVLFPYLLSTRKSWKEYKLRIFIPCTGDSQKRYEKMALMLHEFRIPYQLITTISDFFEKPSQSLVDEFNELIEPIRAKNQTEECNLSITEYELIHNKRSIEHYIKLKELLLSYSKESAMIFVTLPVPREQEVSAGLYMSWLEFISKDLPSVLFIRGNQENVLTYYT